MACLELRARSQATGVHIVLPRQGERPRDVACVVLRLAARIDQDHIRVVEMGLHPLGVDPHAGVDAVIGIVGGGQIHRARLGWQVTGLPRVEAAVQQVHALVAGVGEGPDEPG